ncbi:hypothetical protein BESB_041100 [Besnoitia besnoiti]|uniref:Uncharacterized protein n=1 Tax=Besnoitia besnoiti TaxID=94643 RepID=A0A2A9MPD7_BESBE|nr:hypothetical protein BESB_041100 [Besnoitia besnoiti]PFH37652.1 hypothetical protein BESB_041100 [Besnoitia besnoiti]
MLMVLRENSGFSADEDAQSGVRDGIEGSRLTWGIGASAAPVTTAAVDQRSVVVRDGFSETGEKPAATSEKFHNAQDRRSDGSEAREEVGLESTVTLSRGRGDPLGRRSSREGERLLRSAGRSAPDRTRGVWGSVAHPGSLTRRKTASVFLAVVFLMASAWVKCLRVLPVSGTPRPKVGASRRRLGESDKGRLPSECAALTGSTTGAQGGGGDQQAGAGGADPVVSGVPEEEAGLALPTTQARSESAGRETQPESGGTSGRTPEAQRRPLYVLPGRTFRFPVSTSVGSQDSRAGAKGGGRLGAPRVKESAKGSKAAALGVAGEDQGEADKGPRPARSSTQERQGSGRPVDGHSGTGSGPKVTRRVVAGASLGPRQRKVEGPGSPADSPRVQRQGAFDRSESSALFPIWVFLGSDIRRGEQKGHSRPGRPSVKDSAKGSKAAALGVASEDQGEVDKGPRPARSSTQERLGGGRPVDGHSGTGSGPKVTRRVVAGASLGPRQRKVEGAVSPAGSPRIRRQGGFHRSGPTPSLRVSISLGSQDSRGGQKGGGRPGRPSVKESAKGSKAAALGVAGEDQGEADKVPRPARSSTQERQGGGRPVDGHSGTGSGPKVTRRVVACASLGPRQRKVEGPGSPADSPRVQRQGAFDRSGPTPTLRVSTSLGSQDSRGGQKGGGGSGAPSVKDSAKGSKAAALGVASEDQGEVDKGPRPARSSTQERLGGGRPVDGHSGTGSGPKVTRRVVACASLGPRQRKVEGAVSPAGSPRIRRQGGFHRSGPTPSLRVSISLGSQDSRGGQKGGGRPGRPSVKESAKGSKAAALGVAGEDQGEADKVPRPARSSTQERQGGGRPVDGHSGTGSGPKVTRRVVAGASLGPRQRKVEGPGSPADSPRVQRQGAFDRSGPTPTLRVSTSLGSQDSRGGQKGGGRPGRPSVMESAKGSKAAALGVASEDQGEVDKGPRPARSSTQVRQGGGHPVDGHSGTGSGPKVTRRVVAGASLGPHQRKVVGPGSPADSPRVQRQGAFDRSGPTPPLRVSTSLGSQDSRAGEKAGGRSGAPSVKDSAKGSKAAALGVASEDQGEADKGPRPARSSTQERQGGGRPVDGHSGTGSGPKVTRRVVAGASLGPRQRKVEGPVGPTRSPLVQTRPRFDLPGSASLVPVSSSLNSPGTETGARAPGESGSADGGAGSGSVQLISLEEALAAISSPISPTASPEKDRRDAPRNVNAATHAGEGSEGMASAEAVSSPPSRRRQWDRPPGWPAKRRRFRVDLTGSAPLVPVSWVLDRLVSETSESRLARPGLTDSAEDRRVTLLVVPEDRHGEGRPVDGHSGTGSGPKGAFDRSGPTPTLRVSTSLGSQDSRAGEKAGGRSGAPSVKDSAKGSKAAALGVASEDQGDVDKGPRPARSSTQERQGGGRPVDGHSGTGSGPKVTRRVVAGASLGPRQRKVEGPVGPARSAVIQTRPRFDLPGSASLVPVSSSIDSPGTETGGRAPGETGSADGGAGSGSVQLISLEEALAAISSLISPTASPEKDRFQAPRNVNAATHAGEGSEGMASAEAVSSPPSRRRQWDRPPGWPAKRRRFRVDLTGSAPLVPVSWVLDRLVSETSESRLAGPGLTDSAEDRRVTLLVVPEDRHGEGRPVDGHSGTGSGPKVTRRVVAGASLGPRQRKVEGPVSPAASPRVQTQGAFDRSESSALFPIWVFLGSDIRRGEQKGHSRPGRPSVKESAKGSKAAALGAASEDQGEVDKGPRPARSSTQERQGGGRPVDGHSGTGSGPKVTRRVVAGASLGPRQRKVVGPGSPADSPRVQRQGDFDRSGPTPTLRISTSLGSQDSRGVEKGGGGSGAPSVKESAKGSKAAALGVASEDQGEVDKGPRPARSSTQERQGGGRPVDGHSGTGSGPKVTRRVVAGASLGPHQRKVVGPGSPADSPRVQRQGAFDRSGPTPTLRVSTSLGSQDSRGVEKGGGGSGASSVKESAKGSKAAALGVASEDQGEADKGPRPARSSTQERQGGGRPVDGHSGTGSGPKVTRRVVAGASLGPQQVMVEGPVGPTRSPLVQTRPRVDLPGSASLVPVSSSIDSPGTETGGRAPGETGSADGGAGSGSVQLISLEEALAAISSPISPTASPEKDRFEAPRNVNAATHAGEGSEGMASAEAVCPTPSQG